MTKVSTMDYKSSIMHKIIVSNANLQQNKTKTFKYIIISTIDYGVTCHSIIIPL